MDFEKNVHLIKIILIEYRGYGPEYNSKWPWLALQQNRLLLSGYLVDKNNCLAIDNLFRVLG